MVEIIKSDVKKRMEGAIDALKKEFSGLRTGRAHPSLLDNVKVDAYGAMTPLSQCGNVTAPEARSLTVSVWDTNLVKAVEKGIVEAELGLNPMSEGNTIRINIPELTKDRRKEIAKVASNYGESAKVSVRNVRRDGMDSIKKASLPEDDERRVNDEIQKFTDEFVKQIDELMSAKEADLLKV